VIGLTATPVYNYGGEIHNILRCSPPTCSAPRGVRARVGGGSCGRTRSPSRPRGARQLPARPGPHAAPHPQGRRPRAAGGRARPALDRLDEETLERLDGDAVDLAELIVSRRRRGRSCGGRRRLRLADAPRDRVAKAPVRRRVREDAARDRRAGRALRLAPRRLRRSGCERSPLRPGALHRARSRPNQKQARATRSSTASRVLIMSLRSGAGLDGLQEARTSRCSASSTGRPGCTTSASAGCTATARTRVVAYFLVSDHGRTR
jgi:hypothetical protein